MPLAAGLLLFVLMATQGILQLDGLIALVALIPIFLCLGFLKYCEGQKIDSDILFTIEKPNETLLNLKMLQIWSLFECNFN